MRCIAAEDNADRGITSYSWCSGMRQLMALDDLEDNGLVATTIRQAWTERAVPAFWSSIIKALY